MISGFKQSHGRLDSRARWLWCGITALSLGITVSAQQSSPTEQLEKQVDELKQEYQATTQGMSLRIAALELQLQKEKKTEAQSKAGTVSAAQLAAEQAAGMVLSGESDQVGAKFQGQLSSEPTYDFIRDADQRISKLQEQLGVFEFHGYFRSGYGLNSEGGQQIAFQAPGAEGHLSPGSRRACAPEPGKAA